MLHKPHGLFGLPRHFSLFLYDSVNYTSWQTMKKLKIKHEPIKSEVSVRVRVAGFTSKIMILR